MIYNYAEEVTLEDYDWEDPIFLAIREIQDGILDRTR